MSAPGDGSGDAPYFSVVIPAYQRAHLLGRTVRSVLAQEEGSFEVIVVDDGSTDGTRAVAEGFEDRRIRYHRQENAGRGSARNTGTRLARGRYVTFLDSDDLLYPDHLTVAREVAEDEPPVFAVGHEVVDEEGRRVARPWPPAEPLDEALAHGNVVGCIGVFVRRDVARAHPFREDRRLVSGEDWELWLRLAARFDFVHDERVTCAAVDHAGRSVRAGDPDELVESQRLLLEYLFDDEAVVEAYGEHEDEIVAHAYGYIALHLALGPGSRLRALRYLGRAVARDPGVVGTRRFLAILKHLVVP